jgi:hypothetical protein
MMNLNEMSDEAILSIFEEIGVKQYDMLDGLQIKKYNILYNKLRSMVAELKDMPGDRRAILAKHYDHPNLQVRLNAAKFTIAVFPGEARAQLVAIGETGRCPQSASALSKLDALDEGLWKPT